MIGFVLSKLYALRLRYMSRKNSRAVHNGGGTISGLCALVCPQNIYIGANSYINGGQIYASPHAKIQIGENCLISYQVHMRTDMHNYRDSGQLIRLQGDTERDIVIEDDVWIGYGAQILSGVTVAQGCVIGAGAVVTHDTVAYGVYGGVPARLISMRGQEKRSVSTRRTHIEDKCPPPRRLRRAA